MADDRNKTTEHVADCTCANCDPGRLGFKLPRWQSTDDKALEILRAMRPSVPETALRNFLAGHNGLYLHVDPDEFRRIAAWIMTGEVHHEDQPF